MTASQGQLYFRIIPNHQLVVFQSLTTLRLQFRRQLIAQSFRAKDRSAPFLNSQTSKRSVEQNVRATERRWKAKRRIGHLARHPNTILLDAERARTTRK